MWCNGIAHIHPIGKKTSLPFDFEEHHIARALIFAQSTRALGLYDDELLNAPLLHYFACWRQLTFERFIIELRNSILEQFNIGLQRVGDTFGYNGRLEFKGLPQLTDINEAMEKLKGGSASWKEIIAPYK